MNWRIKRLFISAGLAMLSVPGIVALHYPWWAAAGLGVLAGLIASAITP